MCLLFYYFVKKFCLKQLYANTCFKSFMRAINYWYECYWFPFKGQSSTLYHLNTEPLKFDECTVWQKLNAFKLIEVSNKSAHLEQPEHL